MWLTEENYATSFLIVAFYTSRAIRAPWMRLGGLWKR